MGLVERLTEEKLKNSTRHSGKRFIYNQCISIACGYEAENRRVLKMAGEALEGALYCYRCALEKAKKNAQADHLNARIAVTEDALEAVNGLLG